MTATWVKIIQEKNVNVVSYVSDVTSSIWSCWTLCCVPGWSWWQAWRWWWLTCCACPRPGPYCPCCPSPAQYQIMSQLSSDTIFHQRHLVTLSGFFCGVSHHTTTKDTTIQMTGGHRNPLNPHLNLKILLDIRLSSDPYVIIINILDLSENLHCIVIQDIIKDRRCLHPMVGVQCLYVAIVVSVWRDGCCHYCNYIHYFYLFKPTLCSCLVKTNQTCNKAIMMACILQCNGKYFFLKIFLKG